MAPPPRPGSWTGSDLLGRVLRFGAAGAWVGLALAAREAWLQGYLPLGFRFSLVEGLREAAFLGAALGAVGGLALGAIRDNLVASVPGLDPLLSVSALRGAPPRRGIAAASSGLAAGAALLAWRQLDEGSSATSAWPWAAGAALAVVAAVGLAGGLAPRRAGAVVWTALFVLGWALVASDPYGRSTLAAGDWSGPLAALLAAAGVFLCLAAPPPAEWGVPRWLALPGLPLLVTLALGAASLRVPPSLTAGNPRSVVLVAVDTLRMDRTSLAPGDARAATLTPALTALARRSAVFSEATSQAPWTLPAFASVLTGRYPAEHGAVSLQGRLRRRELTLAEVLREAGYQTAAVVSHLYVDRRRGMAQGFAHFDESQVRTEQDVTGEGVTEAARAWLAARDERPFFLLVHYFDPHYEYRDHADWDFADAAGASLELRGLHIYDLRARLASLTAKDQQYLRDLYDEEVAYTDRAIGRLLEAVPDEAAIVLVGDHGEELLERGWLGHTISLHREVVRVPLVLRLPGLTRPGSRIAAPVETRAIQATLLDYLEIEGVPRDDTASLAPLLREGALPERTVFSQVWLPDQPESTGKRVRRSLARRGSWLLLRDHDAGHDRLFGIDTASGRETPARAPAIQERLARELDVWSLQAEALESGGPPPELGEAERRRLEALGYL